MTHRSKRLILPVLLIGACTALATHVSAQQGQVPSAPRKLIQWGWDEPDTKYMRQNVEQMEKGPFDGVVFHIMTEKGEHFMWEVFGGRKFELAEFQHAIDDLKNTKFVRLTDRLLRVNVTPGKKDWFDDEAWQAILHNSGVASQVAKQGNCVGFMFDTEQYDGQLFDYRKQPQAATKSFAEYQAKARERGRQWIGAVNAHYPDIKILLTFGYYTAVGEDKSKDRSQDEYGLLADFLDGVLEACSDQTKLIDAWEFSYPYKKRDQYEKALHTIKTESLTWTAVPERYKKHMSAGFGVWMDYAWRKKGWSPTDFSQNHFSPAELEESLSSALALTDEYVWLYCEKPLWWKNAELPAAYVEAVRNARRAAEEKSVVPKR